LTPNSERITEQLVSLTIRRLEKVEFFMAMYVDNEQMATAFSTIDNLAKNDFKNAGTDFIAQLSQALSTFEGETKDALMESKIGASGAGEGTLAYFVETQVPELIEGLAKLLEGNRDTIDKSDKKLADAIRSAGKG